MRNRLGWEVRCAWTLACALGLSFWGASPARAATVTDFGDSNAPGQLRTLIGAAAPGDTSVVPAGTITLALGVLSIPKDLTVQGAGALHTIIDAHHNSAVFSVTNQAVVTISQLTMENGSGEGGANLFNSRSTVTITDCTARNGTAGEGAGIANFGGVMVVTGSTIVGNVASTKGGGILNQTLTNPAAAATLTVTNSTVSGNTATEGAGIYNLGTAHLNNVTVANNQTSPPFDTGGGIFNDVEPCTISVQNSIIAGNSDPDSPDCFSSFPGGIVSGGFNLVGNSKGCDWVSATGDQIGTDTAPIDPLLGPLTFNGGETATMALLSGSSAIDRGNPSGCTDNLGALLTIDQRHEPRPVAGNGFGPPICDIGAFELQPAQRVPAVSPTALSLLAGLLGTVGLTKLIRSRGRL